MQVLLVSHVGFPNLFKEKNKMQINSNHLTYAFAASIQTLPKRYTVPVEYREQLTEHSKLTVKLVMFSIIQLSSNLDQLYLVV